MAKTASRVLRTGGLYFNGINNSVSVPNSPSLQFTQPITLCWWMCVFGDGGSGRWPGVIRHLPRFNIYMNRDVDPSHPPLEPLARDAAGNGIWGWRYYDWVEGQWFFVALTYDGAIGKMYVNGSLFGTKTISTTMQLPTNPVQLGYNTYYFRGMIDEVRIYNRALSADEIYEIYSKGTFIKDGLVLYLPFYEGEGNIAHDVSGYGNHGTIYGASWVVKKALRVLPKAG